MSSKGNDKYIEQYASTTDVGGLTRAFCMMSGAKFEDIRYPSSPETVVGTKITFINESDFGGSVPKWIT